MKLEPGAFTLFPKLLPIGPLLSTTRSAKQAGHFWKAYTTCQNWLDQQPVCSVIYVAFGSVTIFGQNQFEELALGLELTNKPFLWVMDLDRKVRRGRERLAQEVEVPPPPPVPVEKSEQLSVIEEKIKNLLESVEALGEAGARKDEGSTTSRGARPAAVFPRVVVDAKSQSSLAIIHCESVGALEAHA
ncbi:hypothetical protein L1987_44005 [Smallanthus sonchifolius]|uniref:Uncharacterized protein n=1 Tax=Smallanthus sonchifolius TaxID=185202 RepID=A0ACB9GN97_9ASTR|nr:hypothetical protein L1987_44005 [Smallanthus sonchifolius]